MAGIHSKNTSPELQVRRELHRRGFRFRLHSNVLPGRPDIVLPKYRAVILVNGCFWHRHGCHLFKWPSTDSERWRGKLENNVVRDAENLKAVSRLGWRVLVVWECAFKGRNRLGVLAVGDLFETWIREGSAYAEIPSADSVDRA